MYVKWIIFILIIVLKFLEYLKQSEISCVFCFKPKENHTSNVINDTILRP